MPEISIRNSCIIVDGYKLGSCPRIENCFKMYDMITHKNKNKEKDIQDLL